MRRILTAVARPYWVALRELAARPWLVTGICSTLLLALSVAEAAQHGVSQVTGPLLFAGVAVLCSVVVLVLDSVPGRGDDE